MAKSRVVRESKLPRCCATGGQTSKARKADAATEKAPLKKPEKTSTSNNKSPLGFLRQYRTGGLKQVNRGSVSPGRRTSSGYDSGPESGIGAAFQGRSYARIVSPYAKVTQPKPNPRSSSGLGSDNSSAVSSDPGSGTQRKGALHRTTGGRLSLGNAQRVNRNSAAHSSGYDSTGPGPKDREAVVKPSTCSLESPSETDVASPSQRSPKRRWLLSFMGKGSKSAPQSPGSPPSVVVSSAAPACNSPQENMVDSNGRRSSSFARERADNNRIMAKVEEAKREQEMLKAELRKAKDRLCVPLGKWTYDLHVLDCMGFNDSSMLEALTQETKILEKRVNACKSHVQMITVFDSRPSQSS